MDVEIRDTAQVVAENDVMIEICNLTKKYGNKKALDKINISVKKGEIMGFLGPNGAGKSTTMNILTGYISATDGTVKVDGEDILENQKTVKKKIGYLPENPPLYFDMTVREYLKFVYELKKVKNDRDEHLNGIMDVVKITHVADRMIKNLSKGYKQRVGLAQALIGDPEVLILDEPTVGLDPQQIIEIRNVIKELGKDRTVILSTHILQEVTAVCDRITIINKGKIVAMDTLENLSASIGEKGKYLIGAVGDKECVERILESVQGVKTIQPAASQNDSEADFVIEFTEGMDLRADVFRAFAKADVPLVGFKSLEMTLEEIFIKVTTETENTKESVEIETETEEGGEDNESDI